MSLIHLIYFPTILSLILGTEGTPALTYGNLADNQHGNEEQGDVDMYPLYECSKKGAGVSSNNWYGACRGACSMTKNTTDVHMEIYYRNDSVGWIDVLSIQTTEIWKHSHVTWYGECEHNTKYGSSNTAPVSVILERLEFLHNGMSSWPYGHSIHVHDTISSPDCSYFGDVSRSGWRLIISKRALELKSDIAGEGYIVDPDVGYVYPVADGIGKGRTWHVWKASSVPSSGCYFKSAGITNCTLLMDTFLYSCPSLNIAFSARVGKHIKSTCVGDMNISTDGVTYQTLGSTDQGSISTQLVSLWHQSQEALIQQLILTINEALGKIETSYCESTCDLTEMLISQHTEHPMVIETPVGPWLPYSIDGKVSVLPCQGGQDLVVIKPIEICASPFMLKVKSLKSLDTYWWVPTDSHVAPFTQCSNRDDEEMIIKIQRKKPLIFEFWRGAYKLDYPYNSSGIWLDNPGGHIHRSSKWFPTLDSLSYSSPINLPLISKGIRKHIQAIVSTTEITSGGNVTSWTHSISTITEAMFDSAAIAAGRVVMWWYTLEESVKRYLTVAFGLVLTVITIWAMSKLFFRSSPTYARAPTNIEWVRS
uniref:Glycoprotein n=1 Tax=Maize mosaic virus TaxID=279896 RepID=A0A4P8XHB6_MMV|nr:glycoprotein [Maize mosaic nucleorhabdovirus]